MLSYRVATVLRAAKYVPINLSVPAVLNAARLVLRHDLLFFTVPDYIFRCLQSAAHYAMQLHSAAGLDKALFIAN